MLNLDEERKIAMFLKQEAQDGLRRAVHMHIEAARRHLRHAEDIAIRDLDDEDLWQLIAEARMDVQEVCGQYSEELLNTYANNAINVLERDAREEAARYHERITSAE